MVRADPSAMGFIPSIKIMGIVNVTPDSFSDGGQFEDVQSAINHALQLVEDGADILDIGGESTRPGANPISVAQEMARALPVIEGLAGITSAKISIDTRNSETAAAAIEAGAEIWNDVSALTHCTDSTEVAAALGCEIVLMHAQGDPRNMQNDPTYVDVVAEVMAYLAARVEVCIAAGIAKDKLIVDPGIGFGKTLEHNLQLMRRLDDFQRLGCPILLGASRKRFIGALDRDSEVDQRLGGSLGAVLAGFARGATIFRVHDVAETRQALKTAAAINGS